VPDYYEIPPAGVSALSFWTPDVFVDPAKPPVLMADNIDIETGDFASIFWGPHPIEAAIRDAFRFWRGTGAAVQDVGQAFAEIKKKTSTAERDIRDEALRILKPFVDRAEIEILTLTVDTELAEDLGAVAIEWLNLQTNQTESYP
jgi:hypothetical protein